MSSNYADILRTPTDVLGSLSLIVRVVVPMTRCKVSMLMERKPDACHMSVPDCMSQVAAVCLRV